MTPEEHDEAVAERKTKRVWYGAPLLATYGTAAVVGAVTMLDERADSSGAYLLVAAVFGSPIVHWANKKVGKGFLSLVAQPVAALIGMELVNGNSNGAGVGGAALGFLTWAAIDIGALAYKDPPEPTGVSFNVVPYAAPGVAGAGVSGAW